jgi:hypothetical protein
MTPRALSAGLLRSAGFAVTTASDVASAECSPARIFGCRSEKRCAMLRQLRKCLRSVIPGTVALDNHVVYRFDGSSSNLVESRDPSRFRRSRARGVGGGGEVMHWSFVTSGIRLLTPGRLAIEENAPTSSSTSFPRVRFGSGSSVGGGA